MTNTLPGIGTHAGIIFPVKIHMIYGAQERRQLQLLRQPFFGVCVCGFLVNWIPTGSKVIIMAMKQAVQHTLLFSTYSTNNFISIHTASSSCAYHTVPGGGDRCLSDQIYFNQLLIYNQYVTMWTCGSTVTSITVSVARPQSVLCELLILAHAEKHFEKTKHARAPNSYILQLVSCVPIFKRIHL